MTVSNNVHDSTRALLQKHGVDTEKPHTARFLMEVAAAAAEENPVELGLLLSRAGPELRHLRHTLADHLHLRGHHREVAVGTNASGSAAARGLRARQDGDSFG